MINLRKVSKSDYRFLYNLLKEREPSTNISHKNMPSFSEHVTFVSSNPYFRWYIIEYQGKKSGSVYLSKNNEIGIFLKMEKNSFHIILDMQNLVMELIGIEKEL